MKKGQIDTPFVEAVMEKKGPKGTGGQVYDGLSDIGESGDMGSFQVVTHIKLQGVEGSE